MRAYWWRALAGAWVLACATLAQQQQQQQQQQTARPPPPDNTGLVGDDSPLLPLRFWANTPRSPLKPRRKDLDEATLLRLMAHDFDPKWMRRSPPPPPHLQAQDPAAKALQGMSQAEPDRKTVRHLKEMAAAELRPPSELPAQYWELVTSWLVERATCPVRYVWTDLGTYFWPRWIKRGECGDLQAANRSGSEARTPGAGAAEDGGGVVSPTASCSWPPGMLCVPGVARTLSILRWHCRLRKKSSGTGGNNNVWTPDRLRKIQDRRKKKRKRYRCLWLKVPYPVAEDCVCSC